MKRQLRTPFILGMAVGCLTLALGLGVAQSVKSGPGGLNTTTLAPAAVQRQLAAQGGSYAPIVKQALPAVVSISVVRTTKTSMSASPNDFPFDLFRGFNAPQMQREKAAGSGVIVTSDGYVLTNNHVIENGNEVKVALSDGREFIGRIVGADPKTDIGLLKIEATGLPALPLGDSSKAEVGDIVLAIGNPFRLGQTVTMGIVSGLGRNNLGIEDYEDFIQTDAAINPGNSGGALINTSGELIGINTAILGNESGGNLGVGFAIPSNMAKRVADDLRNSGRVTRGFLGLQIQPMDSALASVFGTKDKRGVLVSGVEPGGPAAKAGIQAGDIVTAIDGQPVDGPNSLRLAVAAIAPGKTVNLKLIREGAEKELAVAVGAAPVEKETSQSAAEPARTGKLGVSVRNLDAASARSLGVPPATAGAVVVGVEQDSPAANAGLQQGDIVQEVNRKRVGTADEFRSAIAGASANPILMLVNRGGRTLYVAVAHNS